MFLTLSEGSSHAQVQVVSILISMTEELAEINRQTTSQHIPTQHDQSHCLEVIRICFILILATSGQSSVFCITDINVLHFYRTARRMNWAAGIGLLRQDSWGQLGQEAGT